MDVVFSYALCCTYATGQLNTAYREQYCGVVSRELRACTGWHRPDFFFQSPLSRGVYNHRLFYALLFRLPSVFFSSLHCIEVRRGFLPCSSPLTSFQAYLATHRLRAFIDPCRPLFALIPLRTSNYSLV